MGETDAELAGRVAADVATIIIGVGGVAGGISLGTAGTAVSCVATLCTASVVTVGAGAVAVGAGSTTALAGAGGLGENLALLAGEQGSGSSTNQRRYVPSPKHDPNSGWGTPMDLSDDIAQDVLNGGIQYGKQVYGYRDGRVYIFQPDNAGGFHGYEIAGTGRVPAQILRDWRGNGVITNAQYNQMLKWGTKR